MHNIHQNIYLYRFYLHLFQKHLGTFSVGNFLTRMSPNIYWACRTSWGLFLLARSCFGEFLLAWGHRFTLSIEPCRPIFQNGGWSECEGNCFALVLKWSIQLQNKFISKNKHHILIPWHPFHANINFIEFRMSGMKQSRSLEKTEVVVNLPTGRRCAGLDKPKHRFFHFYRS